MTLAQPEPNTPEDFARCMVEADRVFDLAARLPSMPFREQGGQIHVTQFDQVLGSLFVPVFAALMDVAQDEWLTVVVLEPDAPYFVVNYDQFPAVRLRRGDLEAGYWGALAYEPDGNPADALAYAANVVAAFGPSGDWAVWGQRGWDLAMVWTRGDLPAAAEAAVLFVDPEEGLRDFTFAWRSDPDLSKPEFVAFVAAVRQRGG